MCRIFLYQVVSYITFAAELLLTNKFMTRYVWYMAR